MNDPTSKKLFLTISLLNHSCFDWQQYLCKKVITSSFGQLLLGTPSAFQSFLDLFTVAHHSWVKSLHSDPSLHFHLIPIKELARIFGQHIVLKLQGSLVTAILGSSIFFVSFLVCIQKDVPHYSTIGLFHLSLIFQLYVWPISIISCCFVSKWSPPYTR